MCDPIFYFYLLIGLLVFFEFTVRVVTGFGSTMLVAPLLALFLEPKQVVVFVILLECAISVWVIFFKRFHECFDRNKWAANCFVIGESGLRWQIH